MTNWNHQPILYCALVLLLAAGAGAQSSSDPGNPPLGDVVRHQREERHSKTARKILTDDDIVTSRLHRTKVQVAEFVIIPAIQISSLIPDDNSTKASGTETKKGKIDISFGPHLGESYLCIGDLGCAEESFLQKFQQSGWAGSKARILFDSDDQIGSYPARVAHLEVVNDVRGKMIGTAVFIETPVAVVNAACLYPAEDRQDAEEVCEAFIGSLQVEVPKRFIYVQQH